MSTRSLSWRERLILWLAGDRLTVILNAPDLRVSEAWRHHLSGTGLLVRNTQLLRFVRTRNKRGDQ